MRKYPREQVEEVDLVEVLVILELQEIESPCVANILLSEETGGSLSGILSLMVSFTSFTNESNG